MATFLHTRRFLAYHGDHFEDASLMIRGHKGLLGVLPAAVDPSDRERVVSHPGATYGGIVHDGELSGGRMLDALEAVRDAYAVRDISSLRYKAVPWIYHQVPSSDDLYALFRLDASRGRVDLSCAIDLAHRREPSTRRKRGLKKARSRALETSESLELAPDFWRVLEENLASRHGVRPVHTLEEILRIRELFPDNVHFVFGTLERAVVAGTVLFTSPRVVHVQYIASTDRGREISALEGVFERCIEEAEAGGRRFFDFGISTEAEGRELSRGLHEFKRGFGGGGVVHEIYDVAI